MPLIALLSGVYIFSLLLPPISDWLLHNLQEVTSSNTHHKTQTLPNNTRLCYTLTMQCPNITRQY